MRRVAAILMVALLISSATSAGGGEMRNDEMGPPSSFEIPFEGNGHLATIWSWGRPGLGSSRALVLTTHGKSRRIDVEAPTRVRWRSPVELLVEQFVRPIVNGSATRILRVDTQGEILEVLSDREGLSGSQPSPDGDWVLLDLDDKKGFRGIEVRSLSEDDRTSVFHPRSSGLDSGSFGNAVWSPDGTQFAVGLWIPNPPMDPTRMSPHLAIASRDLRGFRRIDDRLPGGISETERWATVPLFWAADGIYARSRRGLLRCDPRGSGCVLVYEPGKDRGVLAGAHVGGQNALLLVGELSLDPLETRATEVHEVNLSSGQGHVLLRLPESIFISDIDWIG